MQGSDWSRCDSFIACDPAETRARPKVDGSGYGREAYVRDLVRVRSTKQEYVDQLKVFNERCRPIVVAVEPVAAQEYLAQDLERLMPVRRRERTKD